MSQEHLLLFSAEHMRIYETSTSQKEVFKNVAECLVAEGYANSDYYDQLVEREQAYPTGLHLETHDVAIPHINNEYVRKSTIYVSKLNVPCEWKNMEDADETLNVSLVFNICLAEKEKQVEVLSEIIGLIQKTDTIEALLKCNDAQQMMEIIRKEEEE